MATPSLRPDSCRNLDVYRLTLELITLCRPLSDRLRRFNRRLGAQLTEVAGAPRCRIWPRECGGRARTERTC